MKERCIQMMRSKYFKIFIGILVLLFILRESYAIYIDMYNFNQLEKVQQVLNNENIIKEFKGIDEFNELYNQNITPIKKCYFLSSNNGNKPYLFGFKLESFIYIWFYGDRNYENKEYYSYPKYDIPEEIFCTGRCYDILREYYESIISYACESKESKFSRKGFGIE